MAYERPMTRLEFEAKYGTRASVQSEIFEQGFKPNDPNVKAAMGYFESMKTPNGKEFQFAQDSERNIFKKGFDVAKRVATDIPSDLVETGQGIMTAAREGRDNMVESARMGLEGEISPMQSAVGAGFAPIQAAVRAGGEGLLGAAKLFTTDEFEKAVAERIGQGVDSIAASETARKLGEVFDGLTDEQKFMLTRVIAPGAEIITSVGTGGAGAAGASAARREGRGLFDRIFNRGDADVPAQQADVPMSPQQQQLLPERAASVDDALQQTGRQLDEMEQNPNLTPRERERIANANLTFKERLVGITPDVKQRLEQMGPEKLQEYLDVVHTRNINDTAVTPYGHGARQAETAVERMEQQLRETGGEIGATRQRLGTIQAPIDNVRRIETTFNEQLAQLRLEVRNGQVVQKRGRVSSPASTGDIRVLNELYQDLQQVKQSPNLTNLIDFRGNVDSKINFAKSAREASNKVDPFGRQVRTAIKEVAEDVVGPTEAVRLRQYTDFMDAYGDLKSFTDRKAGGEYLLRVLLSGRGREAQELVQTIKTHTGMDLMDDATAMMLVTDLLGNQQTRNQFQQDIGRATSDALRSLSGDPVSIAGASVKWFIDKGVDVENVLKAAAAGSAAYILLPYVAEDGELLAPGVAVMGAMTPQVRRQAVQETIDALDVKRANLIRQGLSENSPQVRANEKARAEMVRQRDSN